MPGVGADIVLAVRQAQPSLQQEGDVGLLAVEPGLHREAQQAGRVVDAQVQRVHVGAQPAAQQACQRRFVVDTFDAIQQRLERRKAPRLDGGFVQIGCAEIRYFARVRARGRGAGVVEQLRDLLAGQFVDLGPRVPALLGRRDLGGLEPFAVGVGEEIFAGLDAGVDAGFGGASVAQQLPSAT